MSRRAFLLKSVNVVIGGAIGLVLAVPMIRYLVFPARGRVVRGGGEVPAGPASAVGAQPVRVELVAPVVHDAWAKLDNVRLGAAWLVKDAGGKVRALSTKCPHLGCAIDWDAGKGEFRCPCHTSVFDPAGARKAGPAPRGMDELASRVDEKTGLVIVTIEKA